MLAIQAGVSDWGIWDQGHLARLLVALGVLLLVAVAELVTTLIDSQSALDEFTDRAGAWYGVPLIISAVYAPVYAFLLYRKKRV